MRLHRFYGASLGAKRKLGAGGGTTTATSPTRSASRPPMLICSPTKATPQASPWTSSATSISPPSAATGFCAWTPPTASSPASRATASRATAVMAARPWTPIQQPPRGRGPHRQHLHCGYKTTACARLTLTTGLITPWRAMTSSVTPVKTAPPPTPPSPFPTASRWTFTAISTSPTPRLRWSARWMPPPASFTGSPGSSLIGGHTGDGGPAINARINSPVANRRGCLGQRLFP